MRYFVEIELFENTDGVITCLKLAKRLDDTNSKNPYIKQLLTNQSELIGESPTKSEEVRLDKTRLDKIRKEKKKKRKEENLPENLNLEAWDKWIDYRTKSKEKRYTTNMKANQLAKLDYDSQMKCVDYSISNQYKGLFTERFERKTKHNFNGNDYGSVRGNI